MSDSQIRIDTVIFAELPQKNSLEMQKSGWQAILNNFETYTEEN